MRKPELTLPELFFVVGTRGMLAAGVALLFANRMTANQRKMIGAVLLGFGAATSIPAAMMVLGTRDRAPDKIEAA